MRRKAFREAGGRFEPDKSGLTCQCCVNFPVARTPFDHAFRRTDAWRLGEVRVICSCPHLDGVQGEEHVELLKGGMPFARNCPHFELDRARVNGPDIIECCKVDAGMYDGVKSHGSFLDDVLEVDSEIKSITARVSELHSEAKRLMDKRRALEAERDSMFLTRYDCVPGIPGTLSRMVGAVLGAEYDGIRLNTEKVEASGYRPWTCYEIPVTPTPGALARLLAAGLVAEEDLGLYDVPFSMLMVPVDADHEKRLVKFVEAQACFALRLTSPVYTTLFGDRKYVYKKEYIR